MVFEEGARYYSQARMMQDEGWGRGRGGHSLGEPPRRPPVAAVGSATLGKAGGMGQNQPSGEGRGSQHREASLPIGSIWTSGWGDAAWGRQWARSRGQRGTASSGAGASASRPGDGPFCGMLWSQVRQPGHRRPRQERFVCFWFGR